MSETKAGGRGWTGLSRSGTWMAIAVAVAVALALAIAGVRVAKHRPDGGPDVPVTEGACCGGSAAVVVGEGPVADTSPAAAPATHEPAQRLPRLVDLGAGKCIPCKMMAPILEELKKTCAGKLEVQVIDVWENPAARTQYGIKLIPTQIFYDAEGKERFRHEGFFGKAEILSKWKELGLELPTD